MNSSQSKRQKYEHSYKPRSTLKTRGRNMNTPTNHEQFTKKRQKYEHCYKPRTALKARGRNMNTPTNHEQLSKQETEIRTLLQTMNTSKIQEAKKRTLLLTMNSSQNKRQKYEHS
jgi:hypothetical protein